MYQALAFADPEFYRHNVAGTLNNLGVLQYNLREEGLAEESYLEALGIYRSLASANPEVYLSDLSRTLANLGILQSHRKELSQAEANFREALATYLTLASSYEIYLPDVSKAAFNLARFYFKDVPQQENSIKMSRLCVAAAAPFLGQSPRIDELVANTGFLLTAWGIGFFPTLAAWQAEIEAGTLTPDSPEFDAWR